jgi:primosomal protein N' (replication factor Y) (superfamily II helicase)
MTQLVEIALPVPLARTFSYRVPQDEAAISGTPLCVGDLVEVPFGRRKRVVGLVVGIGSIDAGEKEIDGARLRDVTRVFAEEYRVQGDRLALAKWLAEYYLLPLGEIVPLFHPPAPGTRVRRNKAREEHSYPQVDQAEIVLTRAQQEAMDVGGEALRTGAFLPLLLHGVTGSGKTEVYLNLIEQALESGKGALFLLPEIALTPQTMARIHARFGDTAAAIHSAMSAGQRCRIHEGAARGEIRVVVGPRSALFAPIPDLGVIIVDEEHDTSYKQDEKPRYHARNAALIRGKENQALVVLGSATPSLESMANAQSGRYRLMELPDRMGAELPAVELVDLRGQPGSEGFSPPLIEALSATLQEGRQAILYYNRRGFARALQCRDCGEVVQCPRCDIALTVHLRPRHLLCHYCGFQQAVGGSCPDCGSQEFLSGGGGTEKVELSLQAHFPEARILRLDHDTTRRRGSHDRILAEFAGGQADILVGTQMVAKGHHFPGVSLVGVLSADDGLGLPDFRASERSFQLLTQVAGRAGRTGAGKVIFQTYRPEDPVIVAASMHDFAAFLAEELALREALVYPPFGKLLRLGISGRRMGQTEEAAESLAGAIRSTLNRSGLSILGPAPGVFPRINDRYRFQLLLKGALRQNEKRWLIECLDSFRSGFRGVDVMHDVDPLIVY